MILDYIKGVQSVGTIYTLKHRVAELSADNARLRDLVAKFQRGEPSDKFEKHGA